MRRIAIINQKGGVGKTTTTVNVGMALARAGSRVLLIDLDPQAHLSLHLGVDPAAGKAGVYEMLTSNASVAKARVKVASNLWLVSSSIDLAAAEVELVSVVGREVILRDLLEQHVKANTAGKSAPYDYVLMDCPPSLGVLTLNSLCAAQEVFIPLQPHYLALQGLGKLLETVSLVGKRINPGLIVGGVIVCLQDAGTKLGAEVLDDVKSFFSNDRNKPVAWSEARVFQSVIRRNIKLAESPSYGKSIFDYAPDSNGAKDYENLAREIMGVPLDQGKPVTDETTVPRAVATTKQVTEAKSTIEPATAVAEVDPIESKPVATKPVKAVPPATREPVAEQPTAAKPAAAKPAAPQPAPAKPAEVSAKPLAAKVVTAKPAMSQAPSAKPAAIVTPTSPATPAPVTIAVTAASAKPVAPKPTALKPVKTAPAPMPVVACAPPASAEQPARASRARSKRTAPTVALTQPASIEKVAEVVVSPVPTATTEMPAPTPPAHEPPAVTFSVVFAEPQSVTSAPSRPARNKKSA